MSATAAAAWALAFAVTYAEAYISTKEGQADRDSRTKGTNWLCIVAANWAVAFELVLAVDIWLFVREGWTILAPIAVGAWLGKYQPTEARRRKFRAWVNTPAGQAAREKRNAGRRAARKTRRGVGEGEGVA
jgi:hypothetical protein